MLLWVVLSTAAIFSPSFSQPTRTDGAEENEYNLPPLYRDRSDLSEPIQRQLDAIENLAKELNVRKLYKRLDKENFKKINADRRKSSALVDRNYYQTSGLDTIGGGNLLRRESGLDTIGGGNLLRRSDTGLDTIGNGNLLKRDSGLDSIGGGHLLGRESGLDSLGGGNLLRRGTSKDDRSSEDRETIMKKIFKYISDLKKLMESLK